MPASHLLRPPPADPAALRAAFACVPQGVTAICALDGDGVPRGISASSLTTVSLDPPLISVAVGRTSTTWPILRARSSIGLSVLSHTQNDACLALASRAADRFAGIAWYATDDGAVMLQEAVLWMECAIHDEIPAGDHQIVVLRINHIAVQPEREPLVFHGSRFRRLQSC